MQRLLVAFAALSALVSSGGARATPLAAFRILDLGNLEGADQGVATAVNVFGDVVGASCDADSGVCRAFRWTPANGMADLGAGTSASAQAVSALRTVSGNTTLPDGSVRPFVWTARRGFVPIDASLGGEVTSMRAANDLGQIVGEATGSDPGVAHAFSWTPLRGIVDLGTLGGATSSAASVSNLGHVVGRSTLADSTERGFLWTSHTGMVDVGTLGGPSSVAADVNARGVVVGGADTPEGVRHAFSWTRGGGMIDLDAHGGDSHALFVNEGGSIVGQAAGGGGAFFWSAQTGMTDLGSLGGGGTTPAALNDAGQVVGISRLPGASRPHAFSWTRAGGMVDLGTLPGGDVSIATGVSATGLVVGHSTTAVPGETRPVIWIPIRGRR